MILEKGLEFSPLGLGGGFVRLEVNAHQVEPITTRQILIDRMRCDEPTVRRSSESRVQLLIEGFEISDDLAEIGIECIAVPGPCGAERQACRAGLDYRDLGVEPGGEGGLSVAVVTLGTVRMGDGTLDSDEPIPGGIGGLDHSGRRQGCRGNPLGVAGSIQQDDISGLNPGYVVRRGLPERGIDSGRYGVLDPHQISADSPGEKRQRIVDCCDGETAVTAGWSRIGRSLVSATTRSHHRKRHQGYARDMLPALLDALFARMPKSQQCR